MATPTTRKTNGKAVGKPASGTSDLIAEYAETLSLIDGRLESLERGFRELTGHFTRMNEENLSSRSAILESHQGILDALRRLEGSNA